MNWCINTCLRKEPTFCDSTTAFGKMMHEERVQTFHASDTSLPRSG